MLRFNTAPAPTQSSQVLRDCALQPVLAHMRRFQVLQKLDWHELVALAKTAKVVELAAGRCLTRPGRVLQGRWFLLNGVLLDATDNQRIHSGRSRGQAQIYPGNNHLVALSKVVLLRVDEACAIASGRCEAVDMSSSAGASADLWLTRLAASPLLQALHRRLGTVGWQQWFAGFDRVSAVQGQKLIAMGDAPRYFYLVRSGEVCVEVSGKTPGSVRLQAGGFFGEDALLTQQPRNANVLMSRAGELLRGETVHLEYLMDALWWNMRRMAQSSSDTAVQNQCAVPAPVILPSDASSAALRHWVDQLSPPTQAGLLDPELRLQTQPRAIGPHGGLLDLALLLLVHRGFRPVLGGQAGGG